jgi:hypothetical protein
VIAWALVLSFVTWRITSLLYVESPFLWLREALGVEDDTGTGARTVPRGIVGALFDCFWCMALVVAFVAAGIVYAAGELTPLEAIAVWLASSAGALVLDVRYFARLRG